MISDLLMNSPFSATTWLILFLFSEYALEAVSDLLNLSRLDGHIPQEFSGLYDSEKYKQSIRYQKEGTAFHLWSSTLQWISLALFIGGGGLNWADQWVRSFSLSPILTGVCFAGVLSALKLLIQLPFSIYHTFYFEAKYGFNKTTVATFLGDLAKGIVVGSLLGGLVFSGLIAFFEYTGEGAWLFSWIALSLFQLLLLYLAPALIMPLFNRFTPLPEGELKEAISAYAKKRNFQLSGIFTMDGSKRSTKANAFFTGFGRFRKLVFFDTLLTQQTVEEIIAILAHEMGHFERKHIQRSILLSILTSGFIFYSLKFFINHPLLFKAFQLQTPSTYASLIFAGIVYGPILKIFSIFTQMISRKHEFEADAFARETLGQPEVLISALKKLSVHHLSHLNPHPLKVILDYSHPPILERIRALRNRPQ